jgi:hypothetical protein
VVFNIFWNFLNIDSQLRLLDKDLGSVMKAGEEFDYQRIAFVLEAIVGKQPK